MTSGYTEQPLVFSSDGLELLGITTLPTSAALRTGLLVVVGGPQYRAGSHRQFTLLCRHLAEQGIATFRFDYHGSGDSDGPPALGVGGLDEDLRRALDAFFASAPGVTSAVLWGLCGAASASALYAATDRRVAGLVMLNPWVRTEAGLAKAQLRHYYLARALDGAFWRRLLQGEVSLLSSAGAFARSVRTAVKGGKPGPAGTSPAQATVSEAEADDTPLPDRMLGCLKQADRPTLVVLSGTDDLTANEFRHLGAQSAGWRAWLQRPDVECQEVAGSNHTFARSDWRERVAELTAHWVKRC